LKTTVVDANGATHTVDNKVAANPSIDCFYVYPTVSGQPGPNATLHVDPEEVGVAIQQASQFSQKCRVFAPMYRQLTLSTITGGGSSGTPGQSPAAVAYQSVQSAWEDYLAHDNKGRGVVLIGHSQGSFELTQLIQTQIDSNPAERRLLVSAVLLGGNIIVPAGKDSGGSFEHVPACRSDTQIGCIVAYSTFDQTPPAGSLFGRAGGVGGGTAGRNVPNPEVLCTNPAALGGGKASLRSMFHLGGVSGVFGPLMVSMFKGKPPTGPTPWIEWDGHYTGECVNQGGASVFMVTPVGDAPLLTPAPTTGWGLHIVDVNIALGNLVDLVGKQTAAYQHHPGS
jgi:hypothetical protein